MPKIRLKRKDPATGEEHGLWVVVPPFLEDDQKRSARSKSKIEVAVSGLAQARAEVEKQAGWTQDLIFGNWSRTCVEPVDDPRDWTRAQELYESYLDHGRSFAKKRMETLAAHQALATSTQWGRWMTTRFPVKKRRTAGWFYPLRLKG